jgi:lipoyl(octanoyl) transferase
MTRRCDVRRLQLVTYENGMAMQESLAKLRQSDAIDDQFLLLQHPPVITLGRGGKLENLLASEAMLRDSGVRFYETTRGGDITYHGPGQIVGYPIIHLGEGRRDVRKYVSNVEEVVIRTLRDFGIEATRWEGNRGVWVGREKVAAIGVRIARWVTSHGFALNVDPNLEHFRLITPCGLHGTGVTSISRLLGRRASIDEVLPSIERHFAEVFDRELVAKEADLDVEEVLAVDERDRLLLLHRSAKAGDFWQPVTGRVERGESRAEAAARELREETGLTPSTLEPLDLVHSFLVGAEVLPEGSGPMFADEESFLARVSSDTEPLLDPEEHDAWGWFTFAEAYEKIRWSDDREAVERAERRVSRAEEMDKTQEMKNLK